MTKERAENIVARLKSYEQLERKACTEAGWIALAFSVTEKQAEKMIKQARAIAAKESK